MILYMALVDYLYKSKRLSVKGIIICILIHFKILILSKSSSVPGQGVGSAYLEQLQLIQQSR